MTAERDPFAPRIQVSFDWTPFIVAALGAADAFGRMASSYIDPEEFCPDCRYRYGYRLEGCNTCAPFKGALEKYRPEEMSDDG